ncbi:MAG: Asp23/Gls24 family envelope stress response protein, partial [Candidatus Omnitrophica bacterium]|nr:Asp23/Gls24 family envelope stress response protein [Candidatus Omnitrophota bacterium]
MHNYDKEILGAIKIHKTTLSSIASLAALEVEGVKRIGKKYLFPFLEKIKSFFPQQRIKVRIHKNQEISLEVPLIIKYGFNLHEVATHVQENIYRAIEKMTQISIREININIQGIEKED